MEKETTISNLILLCGEESYERNREKERLLSLISFDPNLSFNAFNKDNFSIGEVLSLMDTVPLFSERRVILIEGSGIMDKNAPTEYDGVKIDELFSEIPSYTHIIFNEEVPYAYHPLYKLIQKKGQVYRFNLIDNLKGRDKTFAKEKLSDWAKDSFGKANRSIENAALDRLLLICNYNKETLYNEMEKLISYKLDEGDGYCFTNADIDAICSVTLTDRVFELVDSMYNKGKRKALSILYELYKLNTPSYKILALLTKSFNDALCLKECEEIGLNNAEIMDRLSLKDWQLRNLKSKLSNISKQEILCTLENINNMDYAIKCGNIGEKEALELIILE